MKTITLAVLLTVAGAARLAAQTTFATPQEAVKALTDAAAANDTAALIKLFGPAGKDIVDSGDAAEDKRMRDQFVTRERAKMRIDPEPGNPAMATLIVGDNDWPLPVPLIRKNGQWHFDAAMGRMQILARRIGRNELTAIDVCRGYVEAQMEYAAHDRGIPGVLDYAEKIVSSPGKKDGLYWEGEPGNLVPKSLADAAASMVPPPGKKRLPYNGFYFRVLKAQGPAAPGGAMDYVVKGVMIGGFALVAWPAEYGVSGIKTFVVSHQGVVYEKDLGPMTPILAPAITRYNPDKTWKAEEAE